MVPASQTLNTQMAQIAYAAPETWRRDWSSAMESYNNLEHKAGKKNNNIKKKEKPLEFIIPKQGRGPSRMWAIYGLWETLIQPAVQL